MERTRECFSVWRQRIEKFTSKLLMPCESSGHYESPSWRSNLAVNPVARIQRNVLSVESFELALIGLREQAPVDRSEAQTANVFIDALPKRFCERDQDSERRQRMNERAMLK